MSVLLRKFFPVSQPIIDDEDDDDNVEYSFAMEYCGPPVEYDVPRVLPISFYGIQIAETVVGDDNRFSELSLPVIQPILSVVKHSSEEGLNGVKLGCDQILCSDSMTLLKESDKDGGESSFSVVRIRKLGCQENENEDSVTHLKERVKDGGESKFLIIRMGNSSEKEVNGAKLGCEEKENTNLNESTNNGCESNFSMARMGNSSEEEVNAVKLGCRENEDMNLNESAKDGGESNFSIARMGSSSEEEVNGVKLGFEEDENTNLNESGKDGGESSFPTVRMIKLGCKENKNTILNESSKEGGESNILIARIGNSSEEVNGIKLGCKENENTNLNESARDGGESNFLELRMGNLSKEEVNGIKLGCEGNENTNLNENAKDGNFSDVRMGNSSEVNRLKLDCEENDNVDTMILLKEGIAEDGDECGFSMIRRENWSEVSNGVKLGHEEDENSGPMNILEEGAKDGDDEPDFSGELLNLDTSCELEAFDSSNKDEHVAKSFHGIESSRTLEFLDVRDVSAEMVTPHVEELSGESGVFSEESSFMEGYGDDEVGQVEAGVIKEDEALGTKVKKGSCYRCSKGHWFTEKEDCIVCGAKYCGNCVLRAMGSMPEGRKCVHCIGSPIDELKRKSLGKCSRMLRRLVGELEATNIMRSELLSEVNRLPPENVYVNGKPLSQGELFLLQSCPKPPKHLKPGYYWYDKVCGLWGKEGHKPSQFVSPQLNVGGQIQKNASNGNAKVLINNREITKAERLMLQWGGVECAGYPEFWVYADGTYQEQGQNTIKNRKIWNKRRTKFVCAFLSLPMPSDSVNASDAEANNPANRVVPSNLHYEKKTHHKLLLVGYSKSGTSTIFKQVKILYNSVAFSEEERQTIKLMIQSSLYGYIGILLEGRERFEEEFLKRRQRQCVEQSSLSGNASEISNETMYSIGPRLKAFSDWLLKIMASGNLEVIFPAATREYAQYVMDLWNDSAFQATYNRRNELQRLPRNATYFLDRAIEISRTDYEPSDMDILYAEGITSSKGLADTEFSFPHSTSQDKYTDFSGHDDTLPSSTYQLIRVHAKSLGEHCKWLEMFEDVGIVLFCVPIDDYDQFTDDGTNKMLASKHLFENIITHPTFHKKDFLLILNKFDLLEEKIETVPLTRCEWFSDFNPVISVNHNSRKTISNIPPLAQRAFYYIAVKFKRLFKEVTGRKLYVSMVTGLESDSVDESMKLAKEIMDWEHTKLNYNANEDSSDSIEESSYS